MRGRMVLLAALRDMEEREARAGVGDMGPPQGGGGMFMGAPTFSGEGGPPFGGGLGGPVEPPRGQHGPGTRDDFLGVPGR